MRRNIIKVADEIKEHGRNEDSKDFCLLSPLASKALGVMKPGSRGGKNSNRFLFSSQKTTFKMFNSTEICISQAFWSSAETRSLPFSSFSKEKLKHRNVKLEKHSKHKFLLQVLWSYVASVFSLLMSFMVTCCFSCCSQQQQKKLFS